MNRRQIVAMIKEVGLPLLKLKQNGHWKAVVETPVGPRSVIFPVSGSDHRATLNQRAYLRALAEGRK